MDTAGFWWFFFGGVIGFVIWFFVNRASVRANRQVELLESIDRQLSILTGKDSNDIVKTNLKSTNKSAQDLLEEARKNAGL